MRNKNLIVILTVLAIIVAPVLAIFPAATPRAVAQAAATTLTLKVVSARTEPAHTDPVTGDPAPVVQGDAISTYNYIINVDNTGTTVQRSPAPGTGCSPQDAGYPDSCKWTSIAGVPGSSPIYTQGTQADFAPASTIPDGRYLISVLADGYKLDGKHFTVSSGTVTWKGKQQVIPRAKCRSNCSHFRCPTRRSRQRCSKTSRPSTARLTFRPSTAWRASRGTSPTTSARSRPTSMATRCAAPGCA